MLSEWVLAIRLSPGTFAHAQLSRVWQATSRGVWAANMFMDSDLRIVHELYLKDYLEPRSKHFPFRL
jgi:hypothetical protein